MKIVITNNSIMYNRGSEAVVRSTTLICRFWRPDASIVVVTGREGEVLKGIQDADKIVPKFDAVGGIRFLLQEIRDADVVIVIGADNYDYGADNRFMTDINDQIFKNTKAKTVLYDCSLSEKNLTNEVYQDILRFSYITVRESKTEELFSRFFEKKKLRFYPDPAFIMPMEKCDLPYGFKMGQTIGINISNLIMGNRVGAPERIVIPSYKKVVDYILSDTKYNVLIMQHVINNGFDLEAAMKIYSGYESEPRVSIMQTEMLNTMQIKYVISKLRILLTARTHASIAAYSTYVPTYVLGYSVKSIGIANDIFNDWKNYVMPVRDIQEDGELLHGFQYIFDNEDDIKKELINVMPTYKQKALRFGELFM